MSGRREISGSEKAQMALARFAPLARGEGYRPIDQIADDFGRRPAVVSRAIMAAFKEGLVEIRQVEQPVDKPERVPSVEEELLDAFPDLTAAVVIDPTEPASGSAAADDGGDHVHQQLGQIMASLIAEGAVLRTDDVVGLGSGRGIFYSVEALRRFPPLRVRGITVMSLTGAIFPDSQPKALQPDADVHVVLMASRFAPQVQPVQVRTVGFPIAHTEDRTAKVRDITLLSERAFKEHTPTIALVGVGVLAGGHRFHQAVKTRSESADTFLGPIFDELEELADLSDKVRLWCPGYCPVGDVANRLFFVTPSVSVNAVIIKHDRDILDKINRLITSINGGLLTIRREQLNSIKSIMLVAGTPKKAPAILDLLANKSFPVRLLCTDANTARVILGERSQPRMVEH